MGYHSIQIKVEDTVCYLKLYRPEAKNTINDILIQECIHALKFYGNTCNIIVLEGLPEIFCFGADFQDIEKNANSAAEYKGEQDPEMLYELWSQLTSGPYITIAHVCGRANAGGIGFVAACDIVLANDKATFSLSELLFGLFPACVLPFLIRRIGYGKAHYMTLINRPISVQQAMAWGLVDASESNSRSLLRKHLLRLRYISKSSIRKYKAYMNSIDESIPKSRSRAIEENISLFRDMNNRNNIIKYVKTGLLPWES